MAAQPRRLVVGITGATGVIYGVRALEFLRRAGVETHAVASKWALRTLQHEAGYAQASLTAMADVWYGAGDMGAAISSGSFVTDGMLIAPCSVRTLAAIATGNTENLVHRAADVILKEQRKLVLAVREAPLTEIHLENMLRLARMGVVIAPPVPAFYNHPRTLENVVDYTVERLLDPFGIHLDARPRWGGQLLAAGPRVVTPESAPRTTKQRKR
jgi:4-hydroxy-3-polyprenylbenzoate decarboxylase